MNLSGAQRDLTALTTKVEIRLDLICKGAAVGSHFAGGGVDVMARMLAQKLSERWNQQFVVENRPGAAGIIGSKAVIGSAPDGYTLLYTPSSLSLTVVVNKTPPYDLAKDVTPIINVAISPYALVVHSSVPAHSLKEFIAYAKANPEK